MAGITVNTVVHIPPDVRVMEIGCIVVPMATCALERRIGRRGVRMAIRANTACIAVGCGEVIVSKRRPQPIRRGVARRAGGWDDSHDGGVGSSVIGYCPAQRRRALPSSGVATVAISGRHGGTGMAKVAGHCGVRASQWETGRTVVKDRAKPGSGRVARSTSGWVAGSNVIRHRPAEGRGALPGSGVATVAIGGQRAAVVSIHVAQRAGHGGVRAGQREGGRAVIES